jgi:hypothetical protein
MSERAGLLNSLESTVNTDSRFDLDRVACKTHVTEEFAFLSMTVNVQDRFETDYRLK